MLYRITEYLDGKDLPIRTETRKQADAAQLLLERLVYGVVEANGGLDTEQGHAACRRVIELDATKGGFLHAYGHSFFVTPSISS